MKGFPNQVADLQKLASALKVVVELEAEGSDTRDDGVFGEALVRRGILGPREVNASVDEYITEQRAKPLPNQSFRASSRGLRELFRVLGLIDTHGSNVEVTSYGHEISSFAGRNSDDRALRIWRLLITDLAHDGGDGETSHPYQVLLRLVARKPGITRAKCALALEARNDSEGELNRILNLADLQEDQIREQLDVTQSNWDNSKKILPSWAEQLGDVRKVGQRFYMSDAPGSFDEQPEESSRPVQTQLRRLPGSSQVTSGTIARAGTTENWDEADEPNEAPVDPEARTRRRARLRDRLRRHNLIVQKIAAQAERQEVVLYQNPFDCLVVGADEVLLIEVKSLDGTESDEVERVRGALGQLLYYESFVAEPLAQGRRIRKVACFERRVSDEHITWLERSDIQVIWDDGDRFGGTGSARVTLNNYLQF